MKAGVQELFHKVADLSPDARLEYFREHGVDESARKEVEALLAFDSTVQTSFDGRRIVQAALRKLERVEQVGSRCGPYQLRSLIGRGGMGAVYLADRVDGELTHQVAIKILQSHLNDSAFRQRFLAERQILANLSHPNIAKLLDAGHREDGQPYLVMEYIDGKDIASYVEHYSIREKVRLFVKVCSAVSYLHRNLVVHRDLKPGNILVTNDGEPKLLDFGIAKLLSIEADSQNPSTRVLTPDYASPEQVTGAPITTATDVYSLGAVLYKLLTGSSPHTAGSDSAGAIVMAIAEGRITAPSKLAPVLRGDLEMILLRALRKEPQERYASADQLGEDLENFLESRPILARRGETWYRARRFLRRHWLPALAGTLAVGSLTAGVLVANYQRHVAQQQFNQVRKMANRLFDVDAEVRLLSGGTKARETIVNTALEYLERVSGNVGRDDPEYALELGTAYMRVARVEGVPIGPNLGHMPQAEQNLVKAQRLVDIALSAEPGNRTALLRSAQISHDRMLLSRLNTRNGQAIELAHKAAHWLRKFDANAGDKADRGTILNTYLNVADQHMLGREYDEALQLAEEGRQKAKILDSLLPGGSLYWVSAEVHRNRGDLDQALQHIQQAAAILDPKGNVRDHARTSNYMLAMIYQARMLGAPDNISFGRTKEAAAAYQIAFDLADGYAHQDPRDQNSRGRLAMAGLGMARVLYKSDPQRSLQIYEHVLTHMGEISDNSSFRRFEAQALAGSSYPLLVLGRRAEAKQRIDRAFEHLRMGNGGPGSSVKPGTETDFVIRAKGNLELDSGNPAEAVKTFRGLLAKIEAWHAQPEAVLADAVDFTRIRTPLISALRASGDTAAASALEAEQVALWKRWSERLPRNAFVQRQLAEVSSGSHK